MLPYMVKIEGKQETVMPPRIPWRITVKYTRKVVQ